MWCRGLVLVWCWLCLWWFSVLSVLGLCCAGLPLCCAVFCALAGLRVVGAFCGGLFDLRVSPSGEGRYHLAGRVGVRVCCVCACVVGHNMDVEGGGGCGVRCGLVGSGVGGVVMQCVGAVLGFNVRPGGSQACEVWRRGGLGGALGVSLVAVCCVCDGCLCCASCGC